MDRIDMNAKKLASYIDHTLLKPQASENDISRVCREAIEYGFFSVCINPSYVSLVSNFLKNSSVKVCSVLGFPFGANTLDVKILEAKKAIQDGANEIDMVINLGAMKSGKYQQVKDEINAIVEQVKQYNNTAVKVIIETGLLNRDEKILACKIVKESKADFVKTSTGFNTSGATIADVKLLRQVVGPNFAIKASGGIRTYNNAMQLINAGANRLGTSSGVFNTERNNLIETSLVVNFIPW